MKARGARPVSSFLPTISAFAAALLFAAGYALLRKLREIVQENRLLRAELQNIKQGAGPNNESISSIAHDLRSPITSIQGFTELLLEHESPIPASVLKDYLTRIHTNALTMKAITSNFLELARLDNGLQSTHTEPVDIAAVVQRLMKRIEPRRLQKNLSIHCSLNHAAPPVKGDERMIERAIANVVENSIKYSTSGGKIEISMHVSPERLQLAVRDYGIGIPADDLPRLCERFYRVAKDRSRTSGGSGLGLAITQAIVKAHGGTLSIESALGAGTIVTIGFPTR